LEGNQSEIRFLRFEGFIRPESSVGGNICVEFYWAKMPDFAEMNFFGHERKLTAEWFFLTGKNKNESLSHFDYPIFRASLSHHIQRLMVGNFNGFWQD